jgi:hypothetical protein
MKAPCAELFNSAKDNFRPHRLKEALENPLANETLLYVPSKDLAVGLNPSAGAIWELCDGSLTLVEIAQVIGKRLLLSDIPPSLMADVRAAVVELQTLGLLEPEQSS